MTTALNSLLGKLLIFVSLGFFSEVLSYSFIWNIFLYLLILFVFICLSLLNQVKQLSLPVLKACYYGGPSLCSLHVSSGLVEELARVMSVTGVHWRPSPQSG